MASIDSDGGFRVEVLGPVEAWVDGRQVALGGQRPRALLAVLALMRGRVVSSERLIDELWGEDPPARARDSLQMHVSRMRKALTQAGDDADRLVGRSGANPTLVTSSECTARPSSFHTFSRRLNRRNVGVLSAECPPRGSLALTWQSSEFPAPNGAQEAVSFLNEPARQGRGEASANLRNDGSAGVIWLEPGSLGTSAAPAWEVREFSGQNADQQAVDFLNLPPRQGWGEASVTPRGNGTVGLIFLEPGSLGQSTAQAWHWKDFPGPNGAQDVLRFLNASPKQGRGEATCFVRNNGSAAVFYLESGTG